MNFRLERVNSEILKSLTFIIRDRVKDPRVSEMVSITDVSVSKDLKTAKVFVSIFGDENKVASTFDALVKCEGFIRHELSLELKNLRTVPKLIFSKDRSCEYGQKIDSLIEEIRSHDDSRGN